jgi:hypothetical protein
VACGKAAAHLCLTLIIKELKISVEQGRVVATLNIIKHFISYLVYFHEHCMERENYHIQAYLLFIQHKKACNLEIFFLVDLTWKSA